ncbi:MAG TPA: TIGR00725 family protein [Geobacteraceae bacterium]
MKRLQPTIVGVIGAGQADEALAATAREVGRLIAGQGWLLVCGGLGGVMAAAAEGASMAGGITIGILPQGDRQAADPHIQIPIATGFGEGRNVIICRTADLLIAVGGEYGTLSEIAFALKLGKPVIGLGSWGIPGMIPVADPAAAIAEAKSLLP